MGFRETPGTSRARKAKSHQRRAFLQAAARRRLEPLLACRHLETKRWHPAGTKERWLRHRADRLRAPAGRNPPGECPGEARARLAHSQSEQNRRLLALLLPKQECRAPHDSHYRPLHERRRHRLRRPRPHRTSPLTPAYFDECRRSLAARWRKRLTPPGRSTEQCLLGTPIAFIFSHLQEPRNCTNGGRSALVECAAFRRRKNMKHTRIRISAQCGAVLAAILASGTAFAAQERPPEPAQETAGPAPAQMRQK